MARFLNCCISHSLVGYSVMACQTISRVPILIIPRIYIWNNFRSITLQKSMAHVSLPETISDSHVGCPNFIGGVVNPFSFKISLTVLLCKLIPIRLSSCEIRSAPHSKFDRFISKIKSTIFSGTAGLPGPLGSHKIFNLRLIRL